MSHAEVKVRNILNDIVLEKFPNASDVIIKPISSGGANCSSVLFEASIVTPQDTQELFVKILSMGDELRNNNASKYFFEAETFVFTKLIPVFEKLQDKFGISEQIVFPKFYKSVDGVIVMENLTSKGYGCYDRFKTIDWNYAAKSVEVLARFHALSLAFKKEYPTEFKNAGNILNMPRILVTGSHWKGITDGALEAVDDIDREKLSQLLEEAVGLSKALDLSEPCKTAVFVHGDFRSSNLMCKKMNGEYHIIPVDYQITRLGCPVADLLYFILMGSDQQFRRQYFHKLVDHYYEHLAMMMTKLDLQPEEEYGRKEFISDMKVKLPISLGLAAVALPFATADADSAPDFERGQYVPRANELFVERFRELMEDFKQWGVI